MKKRKGSIILTIMCILGIMILLYPFVSQIYNSKVQKQSINNYDNLLKNIVKEDYSKYFDEAEKYNKKLYDLPMPLLQYKEIKNYSNILNIDNGMMGYITIDKLDVKLPIYHGTDGTVLNVGVGHFEGSSLPIGGKNTHSILSAHRGLPTSKLFTDLNKLEIGDIFQVTILDRKITYQVDSIWIVEPEDVSNLEIEKDKDYMSLITCTPYGINTHRLIVRGTRIENPKEIKVVVTTEAFKINTTLVAIIFAIPMLLLLFLVAVFKPVSDNKRVLAQILNEINKGKSFGGMYNDIKNN